MSGYFVVLEGGGCVETYAHRLRERFLKYQKNVIAAGEFWDASVRLRIENGNFSSEQELDLRMEDRRLHVQRLIQPALARGDIVVCGHFTGSTIAVYADGHGLDAKTVIEKEAIARSGFRPGEINPVAAMSRGIKPDLVIVLDADLGCAEYFRRVRVSYLAQAFYSFYHWRVVDAEQNESAVFQSICACFAHRLPPQPYGPFLPEWTR